MMLLYCSMYLGLIFVNLRNTARTDGEYAALLHFGVSFLAGIGLYLASKKGLGRLRSCSVPLVLLGLAIAGMPFFPGELLARIVNGRLSMFSNGMALFMPLALTLFSRAAPESREGFFFGLVMASAELLWALLVPLLNGTSVQWLENRQTFQIFALGCWLLGGAGLCLSAALAAATRKPDSGMEEGCPPRTRGDGRGLDALTGSDVPGVFEGKRAALLMIFAASWCAFVLTGLHMGMLLPKMGLRPEFVGLPHFLLIVLLPLTGRMLDGVQTGRLLACIIPAVLLIPLFGLAHAQGLIGLMPLYGILNAMQQILLLAVYTTTARLMKHHAVLPLLLSLAHCLYLGNVCGSALRGRIAALPYVMAAASLLLAAGIALCLWRLKLLRAEKPGLWGMPADASLPEQGLPLAPNPARLAAFGKIWGLSNQELVVVEMLARRRSTKDIAVGMKVKESTVRNYVLRILRKTEVHDRAALLALFFAQGHLDVPPDRLRRIDG